MAFGLNSALDTAFYNDYKELKCRMEQDCILCIETVLNEYDKMLLQRYEPKKIDNDSEKAIYISAIAIAISLVSLYFSLTSYC